MAMQVPDLTTYYGASTVLDASAYTLNLVDNLSLTSLFFLGGGRMGRRRGY